jgi:hypothetical protein
MIEHLSRSDGHTLAFERIGGHTPTLVWLGGFKSDMTGTKAGVMMDVARSCGHGAVRFDYFGHGQSSGDFRDGSIGRWRDDTLAVVDALTAGPLVLVGSSMGGWMAGHVALARPDRVAGMVLIAPAPDFVSELMIPALPSEAHTDLKTKGVWIRPSAYDAGGYPITQAFLDEAASWNILGQPIPVNGPVQILHGSDDVDVPWGHGWRFAQAIISPDLSFTLVKGGDHRLSGTADLQKLSAALKIALSPSPSVG